MSVLAEARRATTVTVRTLLRRAGVWKQFEAEKAAQKKPLQNPDLVMVSQLDTVTVGLIERPFGVRGE